MAVKREKGLRSLFRDAATPTGAAYRRPLVHAAQQRGGGTARNSQESRKKTRSSKRAAFYKHALLHYHISLNGVEKEKAKKGESKKSCDTRVKDKLNNNNRGEEKKRKKGVRCQKTLAYISE